MNLTDIIENLQKTIINDINNSNLHPSICKLILSNVIHEIEIYEKNQQSENVEKENEVHKKGE